MDKINTSICQKILKNTNKYKDWNVVDFSIENNQVINKNFYHQRLNIFINHETKCSSLKTQISFNMKYIKSSSPELIKRLKNEISLHKLFEEINNLSKRSVQIFPRLVYFADDIVIIESPNEDGFENIKSSTFNKEHLEVLLDTLALLHAHTYEINANKSKEIASILLNFQNFDLKQKVFKTIQFLSCSDSQHATDIKMMLKNLIQELESTIKTKELEVFILLKKDIKILFKHNEENLPTNCKIYSFENLALSYPSFIVVETIFLFCSNSCKEKFYHHLLEFYYNRLSGYFKQLNLDVHQCLQFDDFEKKCRIFLKIRKLVEFLDGLEQKNEKIPNQLPKNIVDILEKRLFLFEDFYFILKKKLGYYVQDILEIHLHSFPEKLGLLGEYSKLLINFQTSENVQKRLEFFVKLLPENESQRSFAIETGAFYKEHSFYAKLVPLLLQKNLNFIKDSIPDCYYTRLYEAAVFENLSIKGFVTKDQRFSLTLDCVLLSLKALAKLHGSFLILEEILKHEKSFYFTERYSEEFKESFYSNSKICKDLLRSDKNGVKTEIDMFLQHVSHKEREKLKVKIDDFITRYPEWVKPSKTFKNTLCHGDLWAANLMFKFTDEKAVDCKLVDFQSYRYVPPIHDVLCFIYFSTDRKFRQENISMVIEAYYEELTKILNEFGYNNEKVLPRKEFEESLMFYEKFAVCQSCTHFSSIMLSKKDLKALCEDEERSRIFFYEDRSEVILEMCEKDAIYKNKLNESILDLYEVFLK